MKYPSIVCPNNVILLQKFTGLHVVLRVESTDRITEGVENVLKSGNTLLCVIAELDRPLADLELSALHKDIPLAVMVPSVGRFRDLARHLDVLRGLNMRVYLPCDNSDNYTGLRILSSVGIHCCADFRNGPTDWESLADLATYAVLERTPHAPVEPFAFIVSQYGSSKYLDWGRIAFDDTAHFLHLDEDGRVALSREELNGNRFVAGSLAEIETPDEFPPIRERMLSWKDYFTGNHPCASCGGWRVCLGKFSECISENPGCSEFFQEMIDLVSRYKALNAAPEERQIWQP